MCFFKVYICQYSLFDEYTDPLLFRQFISYRFILTETIRYKENGASIFTEWAWVTEKIWGKDC